MEEVALPQLKAMYVNKTSVSTWHADIYICWLDARVIKHLKHTSTSTSTRVFLREPKTAHPPSDIAFSLCFHLFQHAIFLIPESVVICIDVLVHLVPRPPQLQQNHVSLSLLLDCQPLQDVQDIDGRFWHLMDQKQDRDLH